MKSEEQYRIIINEQERSFKNLLDEIVYSYPLYKINENINSYKKNYEKDIDNLEKLKAKIFLNFNEIQNDSNKLINFVEKINKIIEKLNKENKKLKEKINTLENQDNAADKELENKIEKNYIELTENFILFGFAIILTIIYGYYYKKKN